MDGWDSYRFFPVGVKNFAIGYRKEKGQKIVWLALGCQASPPTWVEITVHESWLPNSTWGEITTFLVSLAVEFFSWLSYPRGRSDV